jgi:hypothetical protein
MIAFGACPFAVFKAFFTLWEMASGLNFRFRNQSSVRRGLWDAVAVRRWNPR